MAPLILHEQHTPYRVFISWNNGSSWWEVEPGRFVPARESPRRPAYTEPPRVTRERFRRPQAYWNQRRHD